uniref:HAT C-terminal dimerisation domain-containing protein n=1 Tax=Ditylenchus dipsaci TaxID=166011 RepID=A0A915DVH7_9BILA
MDFEQSEHNTLRGSPKERRVKISFDQGKHSTKPWKGSKSYGYRYDMLLENAKETEMVICNFEGCRTIFAKTGCGGLRHHLKTHEVAVAISQAAVDEALLKFAVCSGQPMSIVGNTHFISFLQAFGNFWVESKEAGHLKQAKDVLPSANTLSSRLDTALESVKEGIVKKLATLKTNGGSLTLDFAKNQVDYIAVTAHFIDDDWKKDDFVLLFEPLPLGMTKTSNNVRFLVEEKLSELGMSAEDQRKLYITTDEGSNVDKLGGHNHVPCICHIGATIAKHTTVPYKKNCVLSNEVKIAIAEVEGDLKSQNDQIKAKASAALRMPVETRWFSYYKMVSAAFKNRELLEEVIGEFSPSYATHLCLLLSRIRLREYLEVLKPIKKMVVAMEAEKEPTANNLLPKLAEIWLHLKKKSQMLEGNSFYGLALATAAMEAFQRKVGDFSTNWLASGGKLNKELVVCAAFMDPFVHLQLENVCEKIPGLDYEQLKTVVLEKQVRYHLRKHVTSHLQNQEFKAYSVMWDEDPLTFWKSNSKYMPRLARLAKWVLSVQASSSASERAFKELRCVLGDFARNRLNPNRTASLVQLRNSFMRTI